MTRLTHQLASSLAEPGIQLASWHQMQFSLAMLLGSTLSTAQSASAPQAESSQPGDPASQREIAPSTQVRNAWIRYLSLFPPTTIYQLLSTRVAGGYA